MENKARYIYEEKQGKTYITTYECNDEKQVYTDLSAELIAKKINGCTYIKSIQRKQLYTGFIKIIVTYSNGDRRVYTVADH